MNENNKIRPNASFEERFREHVIRKLEEWVAAMPDPDKPLIGSLGEDGEMEKISPNDILNQVKNRTPEGEDFISRWAEMLLDHIDASPLR